MASYPCARCQGEGTIPAYKGILGGVCFACAGTGKQDRKPTAPSIRWEVWGHDKSGEPVHLYNKDAKSAEAAIKSAKKTFYGISPERPYRQKYTMENASARPYTD
jgi:DnaJ-class molecular chaperone